jgi:Ca2+/Na+ antiporter
MAPSKAVFTQIVQAFELYMDAHTSERETLAAPDSTTDSTHTEASTDFDDSDEHVSLIEFPSNGSNIEIAFWLFLFPIRFLMHYTMPDVRQLDRNGDPMSTIGYAYLAALSCLVWLIIGSYAMVASLEKLASLMDVPDSLVGVTVSAAGKDP